MTEEIYISVIGPSKTSSALEEQAKELGQYLAQKGAILITGSSEGISGAAAEGARQVGGRVIFFGPGIERTRGTGVVRLPTGLGELCNGLVVRASDAVVSVSCGWGTLMEIALAVRTEVPIISLDSWQISDGNGESIEGLTRVESVVEAAEQVWAAAVNRVRSKSPRLA